MTANAIAPRVDPENRHMTELTAERVGADFRGTSLKGAIAQIPSRAPASRRTSANTALFRERGNFASVEVIYVAGGPKA